METNLFLNNVKSASLKKARMLNETFPKYALRAIYAGMFLTFATVSAAAGAGSILKTAPEWSKIVFATLFPTALMMILMLETELATSNMMYMTVAGHQKFTSLADAAKVILVSTFFNWVGATLTSAVLSFSSSAQQFTQGSFLYNVVEAKLDKGILLLFIEAILANIFVNLAIIGQMNIKNDLAKFVFIQLTIFIFAFLGFEHVIANFAIYGLAFFTGYDLPIQTVLLQWLIAFIGNLIGGGLIMGLAYSYLNSKD